MKHTKYSNTMVMYIISLGYAILILTSLSMHLNIMCILAPYALLTIWSINYTQKRSTNFNSYQISFELGVNERGNFFKFCILASTMNSNVEILKINYYQTQYIIDLFKLQTMLASLGYTLCYLPDFETQILIPLSASCDENLNIHVSHYEQISVQYKAAKNSIISKFKQNVANLLEPNVNQPMFNLKPKKRKSLTSFLH